MFRPAVEVPTSVRIGAKGYFMDKFKDFGQLALESAQDSTFDTEYFPGGLDPFGNKETTGRWTRDEHLLFIKGLELYGKGWKKIASLVKTRTVVQIRTHAQKYFLKMSKARQTGDQAGYLSHGKGTASGLAKKKHRHRAIAMTPLLIPFAQSRDSFSPHVDPNNTLYHFLSPRIGTVLTKTSTLVTQAATTTDESAASELTCRVITVERTKLDVEDRTPPHWYTKRENIESLLQIAESLDWTADMFSVDASCGRQSRSNTLTSTLTDTDSPCTSHSAQSAYDTDHAASMYGPYYDVASMRTFSPDMYQHPHWSSGSTDSAEQHSAGVIVNNHTAYVEEVWVQRSAYAAHQHYHSHNPAFQPDFTVFDYYHGEVDAGEAVELSKIP